LRAKMIRMRLDVIVKGSKSTWNAAPDEELFVNYQPRYAHALCITSAAAGSNFATLRIFLMHQLPAVVTGKLDVNYFILKYLRVLPSKSFSKRGSRILQP
jgi:hypothetical protein